MERFNPRGWKCLRDQDTGWAVGAGRRRFGSSVGYCQRYVRSYRRDCDRSCCWRTPRRSSCRIGHKDEQKRAEDSSLWLRPLLLWRRCRDYPCLCSQALSAERVPGRLHEGLGKESFSGLWESARRRPGSLCNVEEKEGAREARGQGSPPEVEEGERRRVEESQRIKAERNGIDKIESRKGKEKEKEKERKGTKRNETPRNRSFQPEIG